MSVLARVSSVVMNSGSYGHVCTPEASMIKQEAGNPCVILATSVGTPEASMNFEAFDFADEELLG